MRALADLEEEDRQRRHEIREPGRGLELGRRGGEVEDTLEERPVPGPGWDGVGDVEGQVVQAGQESGLLQVVHAVRQHPGRDDDQEHAGPGEEPGQVDLDRAAVDQEAEQHGRRQAQGGPDQGRRGGAGAAGGGLGRRPEEQGRLQTFSTDRQHGHDHQGPAPGIGRLVDLGAQHARNGPSGPSHPEDHPGDEADGDDREQATDQLLRLEGQALRARRSTPPRRPARPRPRCPPRSRSSATGDAGRS